MDQSSVLEIGRRGRELEVFCGKCAAPLGRYEVQERDGFVALYEANGVARALAADDRDPARGLRGPRTGRRRVLIEHHDHAEARESRTYLRWRCGVCGAEPLWRADRIGRLPVTFNRERRAYTLVV